MTALKYPTPLRLKTWHKTNTNLPMASGVDSYLSINRTSQLGLLFAYLSQKFRSYSSQSRLRNKSNMLILPALMSQIPPL